LSWVPDVRFSNCSGNVYQKIRKANILHKIPKTTVSTAKFRGTNQMDIQRKAKKV